MKKKIMAAAGALLTASLGIGGAYAYYQDSVSVQNHISTGDVNIGIQEYQIIDGSEAKYDTEENRFVLPSEVVSKSHGSQIMRKPVMCGQRWHTIQIPCQESDTGLMC